MELFSKLYSCYYQVVETILTECEKSPLMEKKLREICETCGFSESALFIIPKLLSGEWELLKKTGQDAYSSRLHEIGKTPLTSLQKSWFKALLADSRIRLFLEEEVLKELEDSLADTEPLYRQEDFYYFDRYTDGDSYESPEYQKNFRLILRACQENKLVSAFYAGRKGEGHWVEFCPCRIIYSGKEDKFRVEAVKIMQGKPVQEIILNLARIENCYFSEKNYKKEWNPDQNIRSRRADEPVVIEISGERNSLERCMLHFANYEKKTEYQEEKNRYLCSIYYDRQDETELLIQVLSFGPVIRVLGPPGFLEQVRERVVRQYQLWHGEIL